MIIWTERILEISLESLIFGFFGDFRKFLKINNSRTAEDMKKILVPTVISRTRRFRKNCSFLNLSKIWWFMGGKSRDSLTPVLGTWSWTDFILTLHETSHIMWLSIYIIKSLAPKFITRPWPFPCLITLGLFKFAQDKISRNSILLRLEFMVTIWKHFVRI